MANTLDAIENSITLFVSIALSFTPMEVIKKIIRIGIVVPTKKVH
jgi:hypothetical protein